MIKPYIDIGTWRAIKQSLNKHLCMNRISLYVWRWLKPVRKKSSLCEAVRIKLEHLTQTWNCFRKNAGNLELCPSNLSPIWKIDSGQNLVPLGCYLCHRRETSCRNDVDCFSIFPNIPPVQLYHYIQGFLGSYSIVVSKHCIHKILQQLWSKKIIHFINNI